MVNDRLRIYTYPAVTMLKKICHEVDIFDQNLANFVQRMKNTLGHSKGIGLAANQVGDNRRILVMKIPGKGGFKKSSKPSRYTLINPVITWHSDNMVSSGESCLSFPGIRCKINRYEAISIVATDIIGVERYTYEFDGLAARCVQHEIDHLNGITIETKGKWV